VAWALIVLGVFGFFTYAVFWTPDDRQSGQPVPGDPRASQGARLTSYCLTDGSGMRVYERPFPSGGTQPLFSVVWTGGLQPGNPARCP
jgi:hypothetical protein